jgi:hypothetical protein
LYSYALSGRSTRRPLLRFDQNHGRFFVLRFYLIALLLLPGFAYGADVSISGKVTVRDGNNSISVAYSNQDRAMIDDYYRRHRETEYAYRRDRDDDDRDDRHEKRGRRHGKGMPPGLAKRRGNLPPGLAMRGQLPPGLAKNDRLPKDVAYEPLPRDLERRLPPLPSPDYIRIRVGTDFLILNKKTRVIVDIASGLGG